VRQDLPPWAPFALFAKRFKRSATTSTSSRLVNDMSAEYAVSKGRKLIFGTLGEPIDHLAQGPFATRLPAFDVHEREKVEAMIGHLVDLGCVEICCVGSEAEKLHDSVDRLVEEAMALNVVTTWHADCLDACEYFLFAASGGEVPTLAARGATT
jgi:hypothetical protein